MQFHKVGGYKLQILTQKSKHNVKCSLYVDFIIINNNKELMRANFIFFWAFSVTIMVLFKHSYNSQRKATVQNIGTKSPTKANTDHHNGDLK